jgi:hypothetical protein
MAIVILIKYWRTLVGLIRSAVHWISKIRMPHIHIPGLGFARHLLGFQHGGVMPYTGPAMVGERGPEVVHLPRGSTVTPLQGGRGSLANMIEVVVVPAPVNIDGRKVAEIVAKHTTAVNARA